MISLLTKVNIVDNSGGLEGRCIKILRPVNGTCAKIGDLIIVSIISLSALSLRTSKSKDASTEPRHGGTRDSPILSKGIKKGDVFKALVVRTKKSLGLRSVAQRATPQVSFRTAIA